MIFLLIFLPITWFKKLWVVFMPVNEDNSNLVNPPKSFLSLYLFNTSRNIMQNALARTLIYLATVSMLMICSLVHLTECITEEHDILENNLELLEYSPCLNPWVRFCMLHNDNIFYDAHNFRQSAKVSFLRYA